MPTIVRTPALPKTPPLPAEVDIRAEAFHRIEVELEEKTAAIAMLKKQLSEHEFELIDLVRNFGGPHAQKSKILHGIAWEMIATFSQFTTLDTAAVERFRLALVKAKKVRLLKRIFTADTRYRFSSSAAEIVKTQTLSPKLMALLLQCWVTGDKKPSLDVRSKKKPAAAAAISA